MKIKAILFMSNDLHRLNFTLKHFKRHNPDIPVLVYDNGTIDSSAIVEEYGYEYRKIPNIWHKKTHCGVGSFNFSWFEYMFDFGLKGDHTHVLFLETDVYTIRKIIHEPNFDMAGPLAYCGPYDEVLYDYFGLTKRTGLKNAHTGCGGTIYRREFFERCQKNLHLVKRAYVERPGNCFMDLLMSILGSISGCTVGSWQESFNLLGSLVEDQNIEYRLKNRIGSTALLHGIKFISKPRLFTKLAEAYVRRYYHFVIKNR